MTAAARFLECAGRPPEQAGFYWTGGPVEVAERTWFTSWFSGVTAFDTDDGLVLVDTGSAPAAPGIAATIRRCTSSPVHTAVFTHGHVDHAYGLPEFLLDGQDPPAVVGHPDLLARASRYERTRDHNRALNHRQFGGIVPESGDPLGGIDFVSPPILPDRLVAADARLEVGGVAFDVHHARGETDDALWVHCPERGVLCPGDLFVWAVPNCGNPQKVQRYPADWARALREMAALRPVSLCPGHGGPVVGDPDRIQEMLITTAEFLEAIVDATIDALNDGSPPHVDIVHAVALPSSDLPWLQPTYDDAEFIVRNVIRHLGGWWTGRPSELKPATRAQVAAEIAALAGGAPVLARRAGALADAGELRLACHLADLAVEADPADPEVSGLAAAVYERRADAETSLMAVNLFRSAAAYARAGRPFC
ncbi:MAG: MBL fold metallo-hydrolase [Acidimicrobiia bacterium]|nr:MAG: MBL fold metallo-hydrolase [Acidimicrobiia bacterium]